MTRPLPQLRTLSFLLPLLGLAAAAQAQTAPSAFTSGYRYDNARRLTGTIAPDPDGAGPLRHAAVRNSYDAGGRLVKVETGELSAWQSEMVQPKDWTGLSYGYDPNGNRTSLRKRDGNSILYTYDALNRLAIKDVPGADKDVRYEYDLRGLQTGAWFTWTGFKVSNSYDGFGRIVSSSSNMGGTARAVGNLYDLNGNRIRVIHPDNSFFTYEVDGLGRPKRIRENGGDPVVDFAYDAAGRRISSGWAATTSYAWEPSGRLQTLSHNLAGTSRDHDLGFAYNPASQVHSRSASNPAYAWTGGSTVARPYTVNGLNQYVSAGTATFGHDLNGNLSSTANAPHTTAYVYDVENRLVSASGSHNAELVYDPLGRLAAVSSGGWTRRLVYDGDALVAEYEPGGYMIHRYVHGNDSKADDPLIWYDNWNSGWRRALLADHQGSVIQVADMYGNPVGTNSYDPWGIPGATPVGRFGYTGQAWVPELGLWYYKARFYSPTLGRFLQVDPVGYKDHINLYAYVGNDPVNGVDPTGEYECKNRDCAVAAKGLAEIRAARNFYRSPSNGSLVPRNAAAAGILNKILSAAGSKGDGGVNIVVGDLPGTKSGLYDESANTITLDTNETRKQGDTIEEVLGHELQHHRQRNENISPLAGETRPILAEYLIGSAPTGTIRGIGGMDYIRGRLSRDYCRAPARICGPAVNRVMDEELYKPF